MWGIWHYIYICISCVIILPSWLGLPSFTKQLRSECWGYGEDTTDLLPLQDHAVLLATVTKMGLWCLGLSHPTPETFTLWLVSSLFPWQHSSCSQHLWVYRQVDRWRKHAILCTWRGNKKKSHARQCSWQLHDTMLSDTSQHLLFRLLFLPLCVPDQSPHLHPWEKDSWPLPLPPPRFHLKLCWTLHTVTFLELLSMLPHISFYLTIALMSSLLTKMQVLLSVPSLPDNWFTIQGNKGDLGASQHLWQTVLIRTLHTRKNILGR